MKFGKRLKQQVEETLPEWRDKFLSYKDLKKLLRLLSHPSSSSSSADADFLRLLDTEIDKFNSFYIEQEDFIIRQKELQERIQNVIATSGPSEAEMAAEMAMIRRDIVNFHGEMVLLENYSSINYTGLAKILKKYDKRTGGILRLPFIDKVLKQPFFTTDLVSKLVKECESTMESVFPVARGEQRADEAREAVPAVGAEQSILRNTIAALVTMRELRRGSSTIGHFSLPPLSPMDALVLQSLQLPSPVPIP